MPVHAFARAQRYRKGFPPRGRGKPLPYGRRRRLRSVGRLCRDAGLRADEGIGPYDAGLPFCSVGVDPQIDPSTLSSS